MRSWFKAIDAAMSVGQAVSFVPLTAGPQLVETYSIGSIVTFLLFLYIITFETGFQSEISGIWKTPPLLSPRKLVLHVSCRCGDVTDKFAHAYYQWWSVTIRGGTSAQPNLSRSNRVKDLARDEPQAARQQLSVVCSCDTLTPVEGRKYHTMLVK